MTEIILDIASFWRPALVVIVTWLIAQGAKWIHDLRTHKKVRWFENGGMPSSHTAGIVGLLMVVLVEQSLSMLFLVTFVLTIIVIDDAMGVRWETSKHSRFLNELTGKREFKVVGHKPIEVAVGFLIGVLVPLFLYSFL